MNLKKDPRISALVIAKNEAPRIGACLESLSFCGETVVVDNGSRDETPEIAKRLGAKVIKASETSFANLRMVGLSEVHGDWILYVDADEKVTPELAREVLDVIGKSGINGPVAYFLRRRNFYLGREWPVGDRMQRLFLKDRLLRWYGDVHETAQVNGEIGVLEHPLLHDTHRDLHSMLEKTNQWSETEARLRYESGHPGIVPWRIFRVMLTAFWRSYFGESGWKAGTVGIIEAVFQAFSMFVTYAKLWELQNSRSGARR